MTPGKDIIYYNISVDGKKELGGERIRTKLEEKGYDMPNEFETKYISSIECQ